MEMEKGAVTVTQDIQNVEKCKLNNHQPKIWEVTSTLSPSCLNLSLELSIDHISIVHFLLLCYIPSPSFAIYVPFLSLSPSNISTYFALSYSPFFNLSHTINQF